MLRLLTAAVLGPLVWWAVKRAPYAVFAVLVLVVASLALDEAFRMFRARGAKPLRVAGLLVGALVIVAFYGVGPVGSPAAAFAVGSALVIVAAMALRSDPPEMLDASVATLFPLVLVSLPLGIIVALRGLPGDDGPDLILFLLLAVFLGDTGAYYLGRAIGRRKLAPMLSPKKTWEGAAGAVAGSLAAAALAHFWFFRRLPASHAALLAVLLCVAGILGDLAESMFKRATGVKDSSTALPGHGGFLDRIDSLLFAAPVLYYYWRLVLEVKS